MAFDSHSGSTFRLSRCSTHVFLLLTLALLILITSNILPWPSDLYRITLLPTGFPEGIPRTRSLSHVSLTKQHPTDLSHLVHHY